MGCRCGRADPAGARSAAGHRLEQAGQRLVEGPDGPLPAEALKLINKAMVARDVGGSITTRRKSLDEMQRIASAEAGGPLMTPG